MMSELNEIDEARKKERNRLIRWCWGWDGLSLGLVKVIRGKVVNYLKNKVEFCGMERGMA